MLLWWLSNTSTLSPAIKDAIADGRNTVTVSAATAWEIAIKAALGKLIVPGDLESQIEVEGFVPLPITIADGLAAGRLPRHHDDPFDRMLVAQAQSRNLTLVTRDPSLALYDVDLLTA